MIDTLIIDDEPNNVELISQLAARFAPQINIIGTASGVAEAFEFISKHRPALLFLDIELKDGTGFDLLRMTSSIPVKVIFITAHNKYAIDAFQFSAVDYLMKPVSPVQLIAAVQKAEQAVNNDELRLQINTLLSNIAEPVNRNKKIVLKTLERIYITSSDEIIRFESDGNYTTVFLNNGKKVIVSRLLKEFEDLLKDESHFSRVHQSHLVNLDYVFCYEKVENVLKMKDNSAIPVAIRKKEKLLKMFEKG
jgi:two-component system, LytTR family, response regulator